MDVDTLILQLIQSRTEDATHWIPKELEKYAEKSGQWSLAKKDCETSRLPDDSAPGESLATWVTGYAQWGSPLDSVRIRFRKNSVDKSWFVQPIHNAEKTGMDRALDVLLPLLAHAETRTAIASTIGKALRPIVTEAVRPVVKTAVVETLAEIMIDDNNEPERARDVPRGGPDLAS